MKGYDFAVVLPTLNEQNNIRRLLVDLSRYNCEIIVCDGGSIDGTVEAVRSLHLPNVFVSARDTGTVTDALLRGVRESTSEKIVFMDSDGSHPPEVVVSIVNGLVEHDMVVASRKCKGGSSHDPLVNKLVSFVGNLITWPLVPSLKDRMSGFFGVRRSTIPKDLRNGIKPMLQMAVKGKPTSILEVPYVHIPRQEGKSTNKRFGSFKTLFDLIGLYWTKWNRILKYLLVGGSGVAVGEIVLWLLASVFGLYYVAASAASVLLANFNNFVLNDIWTFPDKGKDRHLIRRYIENLVFYLLTAAVDIGLIWLMTDLAGFHYMLSFLIAVTSVAALRFTFSYFWVWGKGHKGLSPNSLWNFGRDNDDGDFDWWEWYGNHPVKRYWKRRMGSYIKGLADNPATVLNLGCGCSPVNNLFEGKLTGIDMNERKIRFIKQHSKHEYILGDVTLLDGTLGKYQCVLCNEVLEHLTEAGARTLIQTIAKASARRAVVSFPDYSDKQGLLSESIMHKDVHSFKLTSEFVVAEFSAVGMRFVARRKFLWDTAMLFTKDESLTEISRQK